MARAASTYSRMGSRNHWATPLCLNQSISQPRYQVQDGCGRTIKMVLYQEQAYQCHHSTEIEYEPHWRCNNLVTISICNYRWIHLEFYASNFGLISSPWNFHHFSKTHQHFFLDEYRFFSSWSLRKSRPRIGHGCFCIVRSHQGQGCWHCVVMRGLIYLFASKTCKHLP